MAKGKPEPEPEPIDRIKERQEMIEEKSDEFLSMAAGFAAAYELSAAEMFAILSKTLYRLAETDVQHEHEKYFGPGSEDEGEDS